MKFLTFFFFAAAVLSVCALADAAGKPDVVVIVCDDFNPFYTGFAGDPDAKTPRLDALAEESFRFTNCYTASPVCMSSRTSLVTGLYPHSTGCWRNASRLFVNPELTSMFRDISDAGYRTGMIGKTHWFSGDQWKDQFDSMEDYFHGIGIDHIREVATTFGSRNGKGIYQDYLREIGKFADQSRDLSERLKTNQYVARPSLLEPEETCDWTMTDLAMEFIGEAAKEDPFFLMVGYSNPHSPFDPSGEYADLYEPENLTLRENVAPFEKYGTSYSLEEIRKARAAYLGKISFLDTLTGRIVDSLKQRGTWENTVLVFTADHGMTIGEHRNISKGKFWEEVARAPLLIRIPGITDGGGEREALCQLFDIYPTIVEAIGGEISPHVSARSLMPIIREPGAVVRDAAFCEISHNDAFNYMVRSGNFKWFVEAGKEYLFDLETDPYEQKNLIKTEDRQVTAQELRERLRQFLMNEQLDYSKGYKPLAERVKGE